MTSLALVVADRGDEALLCADVPAIRAFFATATEFLRRQGATSHSIFALLLSAPLELALEGNQLGSRHLPVDVSHSG